MTQRVTRRHLDVLVKSINEATGSPAEYYGPDGKPAIGHFSINKAYGGYSLVRTANSGGGEFQPLRNNNASAGELYDQLYALLVGITLGKTLSQGQKS